MGVQDEKPRYLKCWGCKKPLYGGLRVRLNDGSVKNVCSGCADDVEYRNLGQIL